MNIDPSSGLENSDNRTSLWFDDSSASNLGQIKSYRCTFCKRGFSNAQALGGHMNVHRKDRAKLREFSQDNLLSLDISKNSSTDCSSQANSSASEKLSPESDQTRKAVGSDEGKVGELHSDDSVRGNSILRRLPLFAETPPESGDQEGAAAAGCRFHKPLEGNEVLDLELRLGPEPDNHDAETKPKV